MKRILLALTALLLASALWPGLSGLAEDAVSPEPLPPAEALPLPEGGMVVADLGMGGAAYVFTAPSGSVYDVWLFPAEEALPEVGVQLWQGDALAAEGEGTMPALSLRLKAGAEYTLRLTGAGRVRVEVARHALSRCYALPMVLDAAGDAYSKAFARAGDAHWYAVDAAQALPLALVAVPAEDGPALEALLFDDGGNLLAEAARTGGGACLTDFLPEAGRRYYVRLSAQNGGTGLYGLRLVPLTGGTLPDRVALSHRSLALAGRSSARLTARVSPEDAGGILYWESSDPVVARVDGEGRVTGVGVGEARITAYAAGGVSDGCVATVSYVPVTGVSLMSGRVALRVGDDAAIECEVLPENASNPRLRYEAQPEGVVEVDRRGVLRGLAEGEATVTVTSADGGLSDVLAVTVGPAPRRWRALLVGEQNYASTVAAVRTGSVNSVTALRSMLEGLSFDGAKYQVTALLDASRDGVLAGIGEAFAGAAEGDMNLFYITCHGYYAGGMTCFQLYDGSVLTAAELADALRSVRGDVLAVIDCCGSGGVIGRASDTADILRGVDAVFGGVVGSGALGTSRFRVLASAALEQESYRLSFSQDAAESGMATVFARAICEAGGWSVDRAARSAMRADADYDGAVTLDELYAYAARRVMWYLDLTGSLTGAAGRYVQTVQVWPEGDRATVFAR